MTGVEGSDLPVSFADSIIALEARGRFGIRLGLGRTKALLAALGHPEEGIRGALIARHERQGQRGDARRRLPSCRGVPRR